MLNIQSCMIGEALIHRRIGNSIYSIKSLLIFETIIIIIITKTTIFLLLTIWKSNIIKTFS